MPELQPWQWGSLIIGSLLVGIAKTGITGVGILSIALFANSYPPRQSTGLILPLLVAADIVAVLWYRQHAQWQYLGRLFPWVAVGVILGWWMMGKMSDSVFQRLIGGIVLTMVALHLWRERNIAAGNAWEHLPHQSWIVAMTGIASGYATMVANAAGPIMIVYMLAVGLPKMEFMGTGAWFFLIVNSSKLPLSWELGLITPASLALDAVLLPAVLAGAAAGREILRRISSRWFSVLALLFTFVAGLRLVW